MSISAGSLYPLAGDECCDAVTVYRDSFSVSALDSPCLSCVDLLLQFPAHVSTDIGWFVGLFLCVSNVVDLNSLWLE